MAQTDFLTQERLKQLLHYDPDTGTFTWIVTRNQLSKTGSVAGYKGKNGYISIRVDDVLYQAHRLAWLYMHGCFPKKHIDHINGVTSCNKISNLRDVDQLTNSRNSKRSKSNRSGCTGVAWCKQTKQWKAYIAPDRKQIWLGRFKSKSKAIDARKAAEKEHGFHENHGR